MKDDLCEYMECKKVTERNRRLIVTHSGSSIFFCEVKCMLLFYYDAGYRL